MDLNKKYSEIRDRVLEIVPMFADKRKHAITKKLTNSIFDDISTTYVEVSEAVAKDRRLLNEILRSGQRLSFLWFSYFSNRNEFKKYLSAMHSIGQALRSKDLDELVDERYKGYRIIYSFLPINGLYQKVAQDRDLRIAFNLSFIQVPPVVLKELATLAISQFPDGEGEDPDPKNEKRESFLHNHLRSEPLCGKTSLAIEFIERGAGNPIGDFHNLLDLLGRLSLRYFNGQIPGLGIGWAHMEGRQVLNIDLDGARVWLGAALDDPAVSQQVIESQIYRGVLRLVMVKKTGKAFEKSPEYLKRLGDFDRQKEADEELRAFLDAKDAELQQKREMDEKAEREKAERRAAEREDLSDRLGNADVAVQMGRRPSGEPVVWAPLAANARLTNQHILLVGRSGSGKTQTVMRLVAELHKRGVPSLITDFHGEFAGADDFFQKTTNTVILDAASGIDLNPLMVPIDPLTFKATDYVNVAYQTSGVMSSLFRLGDIQSRYLKQAIVSAFENAGFSRDPRTWDRTPPPFSAVWDELMNLEMLHGGTVSNLAARLEPVFESRVFRGSGLSVEDFFSRVTVLRLSSLPNKELRLAVSRFFLMKCYDLMLFLGPSDRQRCFIVIVEAHRLANDAGLTDLLKESRKYGFGVVLASQNPKDFNPIVIANAGTLVVMQLESQDAKAMSESLGAKNRKERAEIMDIVQRLKPGQALLRNNRYMPYTPVNLYPFRLPQNGRPAGK